MPHVLDIVFDQCMFGPVSKKPTCFLVTHFRTLRRLLLEHPTMFRCDQRHAHQVLTGVDEAGRFGTSPAKQYPPRLCYMLSYALAHDIRVRLINRVDLGDEEEDHIDAQAQGYFVLLDPYTDSQ
eukprot:5686494-Karenia_brevis.AAC.1